MPLYNLTVYYYTPGDGTPDSRLERFYDTEQIVAPHGDEARPHGPGATKARIRLEQTVALAQAKGTTIEIEGWELCDAETGELAIRYPTHPARRR